MIVVQHFKPYQNLSPSAMRSDRSSVILRWVLWLWKNCLRRQCSSGFIGRCGDVGTGVPIGVSVGSASCPTSTHFSPVSRTHCPCIHQCSRSLTCLFPDARHCYLLIINASQAIRVQTSLTTQYTIQKQYYTYLIKVVVIDGNCNYMTAHSIVHT